jgi:hypothetical protein
MIQRRATKNEQEKMKGNISQLLNQHPTPPNRTGNTSALRFPNKNRTMSLPTRPAPDSCPNVAPKKIENTKVAKPKNSNTSRPPRPPKKSFYMSIFFFFDELVDP